MVTTVRTRFDPTTDDILIGGEGGVPWNTGANRFQEGLRSAFRPGISPGIQDRVSRRVRHYRRSDNMRNQRNAFPRSSTRTTLRPSRTNSSAMRRSEFRWSHAGIAVRRPSAPYRPALSTGTFKPSTSASPTTYLPSVGTVTFPANMNRGYYESWNVTIQHEFSSTLVAQADMWAPMASMTWRVSTSTGRLRDRQRWPPALSVCHQRHEYVRAVRRYDV